jgi:hypothetical protein
MVEGRGSSHHSFFSLEELVLSLEVSMPVSEAAGTVTCGAFTSTFGAAPVVVVVLSAFKNTKYKSPPTIIKIAIIATIETMLLELLSDIYTPLVCNVIA